MPRTFKQIRDEILALLDESGDTDTTKTNVDNLINQAHLTRCLAEPWTFMLWDSEETFSTVASDQLYALHEQFGRPYYFFNRATKLYLQELPSRQLAPSNVLWNTDTGHASSFTLWGRTQIQNQPSSASVVTIVSSSGSDNSSTYNVTVRGVDSNGVVTTETLTPSGATPVAGSTSFSKILGVTKAAAWNGTMTMTSNSGAVTNLSLAAAEWGKSYQQLFLHQSPTAAETIGYRFYRQPVYLTNDNDLTDIPPPFEQILVWDVMLLFSPYTGDMNNAVASVWAKQQADLDGGLRNAYLEGRSLTAAPRLVRDFKESDDWPRIYRD